MRDFIVSHALSHGKRKTVLIEEVTRCMWAERILATGVIGRWGLEDEISCRVFSESDVRFDVLLLLVDAAIDHSAGAVVVTDRGVLKAWVEDVCHIAS